MGAKRPRVAQPDPSTKPVKKACIRPELQAPVRIQKKSSRLPNEATAAKRGLVADNKSNTLQKGNMIRDRTLQGLFRLYLNNEGFPKVALQDQFSVEVNRDVYKEDYPQQNVPVFKAKIQTLKMNQLASQRATHETQALLKSSKPPKGEQSIRARK